MCLVALINCSSECWQRSNEIIVPLDSDSVHEIMESGNNETEDMQQEAQRKRLEKVAKVWCAICLNLSGAIIIAGVVKWNSISHVKLILFKASVALALISFFTGLALLISVLLYKNIKRTIVLGQIIVSVFSVLAGFVVLAVCIFV